ncbi:MAG: hypothetical protein ABI883_09055, partial [Chthoniobacterales bacterium]
MSLRRAAALLLPLFGTLVCLQAEEGTLTPAQEQFRERLTAQSTALEKGNVAATETVEGWLFLTSELRFLAHGRFWGDAAARVAHSKKSPDPLPAILDFHRQLRERGIELLLVPVPPKAAVYPEKLFADVKLPGGEAAPSLRQFYNQLRASGVDVLDLSEVFSREREQARGPVFCRTDSHWSGVGCVLAAQAIAERLRAKLPAPVVAKDYLAEWKEVPIAGDLAALIPSGAPKPAPEKIAVRTVSEPG